MSLLPIIFQCIPMSLLPIIYQFISMSLLPIIVQCMSYEFITYNISVYSYEFITYNISVYAYEFITSPPKGSMAARAPILMNGVLMSNGVPPFDSNKPVESISAILNKVFIF